MLTAIHRLILMKYICLMQNNVYALNLGRLLLSHQRIICPAQKQQNTAACIRI